MHVRTICLLAEPRSRACSQIQVQIKRWLCSSHGSPPCLRPPSRTDDRQSSPSSNLRQFAYLLLQALSLASRCTVAAIVMGKVMLARNAKHEAICLGETIGAIMESKRRSLTHLPATICFTMMPEVVACSGRQLCCRYSSNRESRTLPLCVCRVVENNDHGKWDSTSRS